MQLFMASQHVFLMCVIMAMDEQCDISTHKLGWVLHKRNSLQNLVCSKQGFHNYTERLISLSITLCIATTPQTIKIYTAFQDPYI